MMSFGSLDIRFDDSVLRPRPWTIAQSLWAVELSVEVPPGAVLELCAGVGHIGLVLASLVTRDIVLVDVDVNACAHARANALTAGITDRVDVRNGSVDEVLAADERFAVILADPPWVPSEETMRFPLDPLLAIDGGKDGLDLARLCVEVIGHHLAAGGAAILQLGHASQASDMSDYLDSQPQIGLRVEEVRTYGVDGVLVHLARSKSATNAPSQQFVSAVAPGRSTRLAATAHGDDGAGDAVSDAPGIDEPIRPSDEQRSVGANGDFDRPCRHGTPTTF